MDAKSRRSHCDRLAVGLPSACDACKRVLSSASTNSAISPYVSVAVVFSALIWLVFVGAVFRRSFQHLRIRQMRYGIGR